MSIRTILLVASLALAAAVQGREVKNFNNDWEFRRGPFPEEPHTGATWWNGKWEKVNVPHTWNAIDMQTRVNDFYEGPAYYRKKFRMAAADSGKRCFLRFEGVGACADVYVNNRLVGSHKGAYSAFALEITGAVDYDGENIVVVRADNKSRPDVIPVNHQLFGVYGGIYRPVWLVTTEGVGIKVTDHGSPGVYVSQSNVSDKRADVRVRVKIDNGTAAPAPIVVETVIKDGAGRKVKSDRRQMDLTPQGTQTFTTDFVIEKPHLWQGIYDPYLYSVTTRLVSGGRVIDEVVQPLGLRRFEAIAGKGFFLNGKKYPMYGVTRHQDWWQKGSALTDREHDADLDAIMDVGATTVRFAHYQQSDRIYSRCDSLGLVVWAEIPFVNRVTGREWENAHSQLRELIRQNYNHPCIYVWGLHNEVYSPTDYTSALTASLHDLAKTEDPDRMTASVNGYGIALHPVNQNADIQGMNRYFGWYEKKIKDIDAWIEGLERDYPWQRLMLTEYGADGNPDHQTELLGESLNWGRPYYPETFQTKTHEYQWSVIAKHPYIIASYLWNMFDFACPMWSRGGVASRNLKGLVSFDRREKKDSYFWYKANWSRQPVLYVTQRRNADRERRETSITVYCNRGVPEVALNGRPLPRPRQGYTEVHWIFDGVVLDDGDNIISARTTGEGEVLSDTVRWIYSGEKDRSPEKYENRKTHSGF